MARALAWSPEAIEDIESIAAYIERDSAWYAKAVASKIVETAETIPEFPELGRMVPEVGEKWLRLFEQFSPIYKWIPGGSQTVQSCPRRRARGASHAHERATRWATRGAPRTSSYAASLSLGKVATYFSCGVSRSSFECGRSVLYQSK